MKYLEKTPSIVVLTGAGISADSGIQTFRASDGLWENHRVEDVASPEGFAKNPKLVHRFYQERFENIKRAKPNDAHYALAEFAQNFSGEFLLITQNIDDLHERAGQENLLHMHGEIARMLCQNCQNTTMRRDNMPLSTPCPHCQHQSLRPDIVWFGEMPYHMEQIWAALENCTHFIAIGTSGHVYPAAGFAQFAQSRGAYAIELNLEPSQNARDFDEGVYGKAIEIVPKFMDEFL